MTTVHLAPDCEAERQFLPDPATLTDCLLLADRGYPSVPYFEAVRAHGGAFVIRLSASHDPYVGAAWTHGRRLAVPREIRLSRFLAQHPGASLDLDIEYRHSGPPHRFRLVVVPGRANQTSRLCTNLPRASSTRFASRIRVNRLSRRCNSAGSSSPRRSAPYSASSAASVASACASKCFTSSRSCRCFSPIRW